MSNLLHVVPYREQPELTAKVATLEAESFPPFIESDPVWAEVTPHFYDEFADFQFFIVDDDKSSFVGVCNSVPFNWDGDPDHLPGYHEMLTGGLADWRAGKKPNTMSGIQLIIDPAYRGQNVPEIMFAEIARLTLEHGMTSLMTALRPTLKHQYPLCPIEEYAYWRRNDGQLFDPWLRAIERMGGELIKPVAESTVIEAPISTWEGWTGMEFPADGEYWLPEGLSTLHIDLSSNTGRHCEPHVWFQLPV